MGDFNNSSRLIGKGEMRLMLILSFLVFPIIIRAQDSYFESIDNLSEVKNPEVFCINGFVWRSGTPRGYQYVAVEMNQLLYETKHAFRWPDQMSLTDRMNLRLVNPDIDILFTSNLILSDNDSLQAWVSGRIVSLQKVALPGIIKMRSPQPASIQDAKSQDPLQNIRKLPALIEVHSLDELKFVVSASNFVPQVVSIPINPGNYKSIEVQLQPIPRFKLPMRTLEIDTLKSVSSDSLKRVEVDSLLAQAFSWFEEDSSAVESFKLKVSSMLPDHDFDRSLRDYTMQNAMELNGLVKFLQESRERIQLLKNIRNEIISGMLARERLKLRNPYAQMIREFFHHRVFIGVNGLVGRNIPKDASNPGPDGMWGVSGSLSWHQALFSKLLLEPRIDGLYAKWKFNQDVNQFSEQVNMGATLIMDVPVIVAPSLDSLGALKGGTSLSIAFGPSFQVRRTRIHDMDGFSAYNGISFGSAFQMKVSMTRLPFVVSLEYRYYQDAFGEVLAGISLPLGRMP